MKHRIQSGAILASAVAFSTAASAAAQSEDGDVSQGSAQHAVFVQTNDPRGNAVVVYDRRPDGSLAFDASYPTGGNGSRAIGAPSDPLASQNSLVYDRAHRLLFAVNAGSDTISVFDVDGDRLALNQVVPSGGPFPASIAVRGNLAYVLDAGLSGFVSGFRIESGRVTPIEGSTRTLGLANTNPPFFLSSPAQVGFTPDAKQLAVTTKSSNTVDVFRVDDDGTLSPQPVRNVEAPLPFAFVFGSDRLLVLANAGDSSLATFTTHRDGTLTPAGAPVSDGQAAACWVVDARDFEYVANTGSGDISQFRVRSDGTVALVNAMAATGVPGATDMTIAAGGTFLYVLSGTTASVFAYRIGEDGSLRLIETMAVPDGTSMEGIAAN